MPVCRRNLEGIVCLIIAYTVYGLGYYSLIGHVVRPHWSGGVWSYINMTILHSGLLLSLYSFIRATFSNPGMVALSNVKIDFSDFPSRGRGYPNSYPSQSSGEESHESQENWVMCKSCETYKPPQAEHCRKCKRCIKRRDHHCVWINNCVGERNKKFLVLFCFYTTLLCFYSFVFSLISWFLNRHSMQTVDTVFVIIAVLLFLIFGIFTAGTLANQLLGSIWDNYSSARWIFINGKRVKRVKKPIKIILQEIFGHKWMCLWLLPCISPSDAVTETRMI